MGETYQIRDQEIEHDEMIESRMNYIHENPVRAEIVEKLTKQIQKHHPLG